jgi:hypothetical protein
MVTRRSGGAPRWRRLITEPTSVSQCPSSRSRSASLRRRLSTTPEPASPFGPGTSSGRPVGHGHDSPLMLDMHVILQDISMSRGGCSPLMLEGLKCLSYIRA